VTSTQRGQPFKADEGPDGRRTQRADQTVERRLSTGIPLQLGSSEDLDGDQIRFACQDVHNERTERLCLGGAPNPAGLALARRVDVRDRCLSVDALHASAGHAGERAHLDLTVTGAPQNLDFVPFEHVDHPFPAA
jgi:hypothetical protein